MGVGFSAGWANVVTSTTNQITISDKVYTTGEPDTSTGEWSDVGSMLVRRTAMGMPFPVSRAWVYLSSADGLQGMWAYCGIAGGDFDILFYVNDQFDEVTTTAPHTATSTWKWYLALIPCRALRYLDVETPEKSKRRFELWATMMNLDADTAAQFVRFYEEYDEEPTDSITMTRQERPNGDNSNVYLNRNQVPSDLLNSFGIEFIEYGYANFQLLNFVLKANAA